MSMQAPSGAMPGNKGISGYNHAQLPNFTPQQMQLFQSLIGGSQGGINSSLANISKLAQGDQGAFEALEAPAYEGFNRTLGQIGSRFSGLGARNSSGFQNAVYGAGADLAQQLQSQRFGIQQQSQESLLGLANSLLGQQPYQNFVTPKDRDTSGADWLQLLGNVAPEIIKLLPFPGKP